MKGVMPQQFEYFTVSEKLTDNKKFLGNIKMLPNEITGR